MRHDILDELRWRGLIHQCTDESALRETLATGSVSLYCGFDPTASSLHVGSLIPLVTLRRFLMAGHRPIALVGGATGLIGDPSGKSAERVLQTPETVAAQAEAIRRQVSFFTDGVVRDNLAWTQPVTLLEFLRDVGKHFSVNAMIARDSVASRLSREGEGISFTEFSYMLLQANDFAELARREGCLLQIGGSDQWGNMCSGADLIRRTQGRVAHALTLPLLTTADGQKFGKTVNGAVWLDATRTSPWEFFQFWMNTEDADVVRFLKLFTFLDRARIEALERAVIESPAAREAQRTLAMEMTAMVHGGNVAREMLAASQVLFGKPGQPVELEASTLGMLAVSLPAVPLVLDATRAPVALNGLLVAAGLVESKTQATQLVRQGGVSVNNVVRSDPAFVPSAQDWLAGRFLLLKKGKKSFALLERIAS